MVIVFINNWPKEFASVNSAHNYINRQRALNPSIKINRILKVSKNTNVVKEIPCLGELQPRKEDVYALPEWKRRPLFIPPIDRFKKGRAL